MFSQRKKFLIVNGSNLNLQKEVEHQDLFREDVLEWVLLAINKNEDVKINICDIMVCAKYNRL